jgi:hypothetical protein
MSNKAAMHKVPTYQELIDEIIHPTDKIALPDRMATQLRGTQQLSRFDDSEASLDLAGEQDKIQKERATEAALHNLGTSQTASVARAQAQSNRSAASSRTLSWHTNTPVSQTQHPPQAATPQGYGASTASMHSIYTPPGGTPMASTGVFSHPTPFQQASSSSSTNQPALWQTGVYEEMIRAAEERQTLITQIQEDMTSRQALNRQQVNASLNNPTSRVDEFMPSAPASQEPRNVERPDVPMFIPPEAPSRRTRTRSGNRGGDPTQVMPPRNLAVAKAKSAPNVPMVQDIKKTPKPKSTELQKTGNPTPVPAPTTKARSRSKELIAGPVNSITEGGVLRGRSRNRGRQTASSSAAAAAAISSSERSVVPVGASSKGISISSSASTSKSVPYIGPRTNSSVASASSVERPDVPVGVKKSRAPSSASSSKSTPYVGPAASSSAAAAAPADKPDVPVGDTPGAQPTPAGASQRRIWAELLKASKNGVLTGTHLANYQRLVRGIENMGPGFKKSSFDWDELRLMYKLHVYKKPVPPP